MLSFETVRNRFVLKYLLVTIEIKNVKEVFNFKKIIGNQQIFYYKPIHSEGYTIPKFTDRMTSNLIFRENCL